MRVLGLRRRRVFALWGKMRVLGSHLAFQHHDHGQIQALIPSANSTQGWVVVPHTLQAVMVLRNIGLDAPSPIRHGYDWPGKYTPYKHQIVTAEFITLNKRAFVLNGMGSGKSCSALWAADYLKKQGLVNRILVVSPLSTLETVWGREIFTNFPGRSYSVLHGSSAKRRKLLAEQSDFYIINHHGLKVIQEDLAKRSDINLIIFDELAVMRNAQTGLFKAAKKILTPDKWAWGLTGSPTPQSPTDAYAQAKLIKPENVPFSFTRFKQEIMLQVSPFKWVPRRHAEQAVAGILSPSIRFALRECIDLPPTITQYRKVEMTAEQKTHYNKLLKDCMTEIRGTTITAVNAAVLLSKILQAATGVLYAPDGKTIKIDCQHRIAEVKEIVTECEDKVIVFVPLTGALHAVRAELDKWFESKGESGAVGLVEGATSKGLRQKTFDEFQFGDKMKVLCANPQAMAHGLSLTAATTTIYFAPPFSSEVYEQSAARTIRPGQTKTTNIINIMATPEEERVYKSLADRKKFLDVVLDLIKNH